MIPENIIYISVLLSFIGYFFYFKDIFYGQTRPNLVSWFLWLLGPFIGVFFQIKAGAGLSVLPIFLAGFGPLIVVIICLFKRNFIWKITKFDIFCGLLSLLALVFYGLTHNLSISIIFAISSDLLAFIPTYIKGWKFPETESYAPYLSSIFSNMLGLLIIKDWSFTIYSFGFYLVFANLIFIFILYRKRIFNIHTSPSM
jgi:hypothetical protein